MAAKGNQLRIVGGRHRGRRLSFPDQPGLRPTSDRVRETLFNWVAPVIAGARCLDVFAGSGALGFEAASRGAGEVVMLERAPRVVSLLRRNARLLGLDGTSIHQVDSLEWLGGRGRPFDLVFLDPPFADGLLEPVCERLVSNGWLTPGSRIYLEAAAKPGFPPLPNDWELVRDKTAGQVRYGLALVGEDAGG
ncbi:16S rRNA (guanine(966)-N(2))-methyltransferase RsmD [Imhoffiella purpurea]|uniref:Ribosomal RNA small subunit methyltransferase D n=1 Tax=Imhoffiella purpurea TaxID=1249627 RepID=W9V8I6_9GAMM|nr:16S rRNA (guanine(966)-N(2))-methyltransferase RsmD [Imhoffiella purpurea]EXJ15749.1 Ribosomal RNA small subunit methyltransferase D [Imhoffiella purpurea]